MTAIDSRRWAKRLVPLTLIWLCSAAGCGTQASSRSAAKSSVEPGTPASYTRAPGGYVEGDGDSDDIYHSHKDSDDGSARGYGREASAQDRQSVGRLVKLYYEAGAAGSGARACALIYRPIARRRDFADIVPEAYALVAESSLFSHRSCAEVESVLFELNRKTLTAGTPSVTVVDLRAKGDHGIALLGFTTMPERQIAVEREHGRWMIDALLDGEII